MNASAALTKAKTDPNLAAPAPELVRAVSTSHNVSIEGVLILEAVANAQTSSDLTFRVLAIDDICQHLLDISEPKPLGKPLRDCLPDKIASTILLELNACWANQTTRNFELLLPTAPISVSLLLMRSGDNPHVPARMIGICQIQAEDLRALLHTSSDQTWQPLIDGLPGIAFRASHTPDWSLSYLSRGCLELTGYSQTELLSPEVSTTYNELIHPDDLIQVLTTIDQAIAQRQPYQVEYRIRNRQQQQRWFWEKGEGLFDSTGQVLGLQGFITDITSLKVAEASLVESNMLLQTQQALLRDMEAHYQSVFENAVAGIFQATPAGQYLKANLALAQMYGYESPEALIAGLARIHHQPYVHPQHRTNFILQMQRHGVVRHFESEVYRSDGSIIWISENAWAIKDQTGHFLYYEGTVEDITERKNAELELQRRDELLQGIADAMNFLLTVPHYESAVNKGLAALGQAAGVDRVYIYENHPHPETGQISMSMRYEWTRSGVPASIAQPHWQNQSYANFGMMRWYQSLSKRQIVKEMTRLLPPEEQTILQQDQIQSILMVPILVDGYFWGYIGFDDCRQERYWTKTEESILQAMACSFGGTLKRQIAEATIRYQAFYDPLTSLPNRLLLSDRLQLAILNAKRANHCVAVLFLDLDRFKTINDTLGHATGDRILQMVSERLQGCLCQGDTVARWGGDEFTLLLPQVKAPEELALIARRILDSLKPAFQVGTHQLHLSGTMGIAVYPQDGTDADMLLCQADVALYRAKDQGRNHYQFYIPDMTSTAAERLTIETQLYTALERQELMLYYQPRVNLKTWQVTGLEALLRWQNPNQGFVMPGTFIPIAEDNGLILSMGEWAIRTACLQNKTWQDLGLPPLRVSVNLSARQFQDPNLVAMIEEVLEETQLDPQWLELEITETTVMQNIEFTRLMLEDLSQMGVHLSIDDFGTGHSSLSYLKRFPLHSLKIDRSFVKDLKPNSPDAAIAAAVVALGQGLNLKVVAEGVETQEQLDVLQSLQCAEMQGYFFSRPLPLAEITNLLEDNARIHDYRVA